LTEDCSRHNLTFTIVPEFPFSTFTLTHITQSTPCVSFTLAIRPTGISAPLLDLDAIRVTPAPTLANTGTFGLGLLGTLGLAFGRENGCVQTEFLAIDDSDFQHRCLVRYYKRMGLKTVRYVGDRVKDVPDRLTWGGGLVP